MFSQISTSPKPFCGVSFGSLLIPPSEKEESASLPRGKVTSIVGEKNRDHMKSLEHIYCERRERNQTNWDHVLGQALEVILASGLNGFPWGRGRGR